MTIRSLLEKHAQEIPDAEALRSCEGKVWVSRTFAQFLSPLRGKERCRFVFVDVKIGITHDAVEARGDELLLAVQDFVLDDSTWTSAADLLAGTGELEIAIGENETCAFYQIRESDKDPNPSCNP